MLKKGIIVLSVLLVGGWLWAKTDLGSYARTAWKQVRTSVKSQVPVDFEIKRARDMLANLDKEEDKLISAMAREMVAIEGMEKEIARDHAFLEKQEREIKTANDELKSTTRPVYFWSGLEMNREQFAIALERQFERFQANEGAVKAKKNTLVYHKETLAAAKEQLDGLKASKNELLARIELAEIELRNVQAAQTRSRTQHKFDDSQLARVKGLVDEIETSIRTQKYELRLRGDAPKSNATVPVKRSNPDLSKEIDSHFGGSKTTSVAAEKK